MQTADVTVQRWLDQLADHAPTPGGGAAAALSAAISAALLGMVAKFTTGPKWADREERMRRLDAELSELRGRALDLADQDAAAFAAVSAAYKLPKTTDDEMSARRAAIQRALTAAAVPPAQVGQLAARLITIAEELDTAGNPNVVSDVAVASSTARAAIESAIVNIEINRQQIRDPAETGRLGALIDDLAGAVQAADSVTNSVRKKVQ
jgi:formiminotetrahydrofolate cyclodeaminase